MFNVWRQNVKQHEEHTTLGHKSDFTSVRVQYVPSVAGEGNTAISNNQLRHAHDWAVYPRVLKHELMKGAIGFLVGDGHFTLIWNQRAVGTFVLQAAALALAFSDWVTGEGLRAVSHVWF